MASAPPRMTAQASAPPPLPRRTTADRSVSLRHPPRHRLAHRKQRNSDSSSDGGCVVKAGTQQTARSRSFSFSPSSLNPLGGQVSSGESSNAEEWFEKSNNEVQDHRIAFADNDPPFFMRNSSSSETPPEAIQRQQQQQQQQQQRLRQLLDPNESTNSLPLRTGLLQLGTDGSSTEDFRSVIDDLTIKNKKLRRRLKKYEKLHDSHLKDDKLFEVRFHGLPPAKKRELEETLRKFAAGLHTGGANAFPSNGYASLVPMLNTTKTASSQTSIQNADSAYASMSASHPGSSGQQSASDAKAKLTPSSSLAARRQNIHSYLHDIPESLLPHHTPTSMTERAKKKLVVRRLEGVFAGKDAAKNGHQHALQQQEVSQSAARADRSAIEASGQRLRQEGAREAAIMRSLAAEQALQHKQAAGSSAREGDKDSAADRNAAASTDEANLAACDQRPTRPLDLDIQRAQVPADNIRYMRHLGFSPLDPEVTATQEHGHGWIYLNFLINMAQLHTINVTPDFVRKALGEYSNKFDISPDGRKVRWRGSDSGPRASSSGDNSSHSISANTPDGQYPRKRPKLSHNHSYSTAGGRAVSEVNKYAYTPLFFHRDSTDEADDSSSEEDGDESPMQAQIAGDSSVHTVSGLQTSSGLRTVGPAAKKKKRANRDDGPIIFYNNANFCTDLSGDARPQTGHDQTAYTTAIGQPIGKAQAPPHELFEQRGPLDQASELPEPMNLSDNPIPESMELAFPQRSPHKADSNDRDVYEKPVELEVTGIGGVWPADNFAISVESRHVRTDQTHAHITSGNVPARSLPSRLTSILEQAPSTQKGLVKQAAIRKQILTSKLQVLPPTPLPPALEYRPFGEEFMDEDDDESDDGDRMSVSPESPGDAFPPSTAPQPVDFAYASSDSDSNSSDSSSSFADDSNNGGGGGDSDDDGSVDLLAAARQVDPEAVRAKEREYDANMAERLAEEIPAGSSAATAGGGSGFTSPASGVTREEYVRARKEARANAAAGANATPTTTGTGKGTTDAGGSGATATATSNAAAKTAGAMNPPRPPPPSATRPAGLKRARTSDCSMVVTGRSGGLRGASSSDGGSSSSGEDDEDDDEMRVVSDIGS